MKRHYIIVLLVISCLLSCKKEQPVATAKPSPQFAKGAALKKINDSLKHEQEINMDFISDSLLHKDRSILRAYLKRYRVDTCGYAQYDKKRLKEEFTGIKTLKDVNGDGKNDSVFILLPLTECDGGKYFVFTDSAIPRLAYESFCPRLDYIFPLPEIDEDGKAEIGVYRTVCVSRVKRVYIYSLKGNEWEEIGSAAFDTGMQDPEKTNFESLVRKTGKGSFKICEFLEGQTEWLSFNMNL